MAEEAPSKTINQPDGIPPLQIFIRNSRGAGDLAVIARSEKTFAGNKCGGDSSNHLGDGKAFLSVLKYVYDTSKCPFAMCYFYHLRLTII